MAAAIAVATVAVLAFEPNTHGVHAWALLTGAAVAVLLLNVLHPIGVDGDRDRNREQA